MIVEQVRAALTAHFPGAATIELATRTVCWRARRTRRDGAYLQIGESASAKPRVTQPLIPVEEDS